MKKKAVISLFLAAAILLTANVAVVHALDDIANMQCDGVIAEIGDQKFDLQQKCGPPSATEENGQVWIYDRRPDDFVYYVTFDDDRVERIQVGNGE